MTRRRRRYDPLIPGDPDSVARCMMAAIDLYNVEHERRARVEASRFVLDVIEETEAMREVLAIAM